MPELDCDNENKLLKAVFDSDVKSLGALVKSGFKINKIVEQYDLLHVAAQKGDAGIIRIILSAGCKSELNRRDDIPYLPLTYAALGNHMEAAQVLLDEGADINDNNPDIGANSVLRDAVFEASVEMIEFLLKNKADPKIRGWMQLNSLDMAKSRYEKNKTPENKKILDLVSK